MGLKKSWEAIKSSDSPILTSLWEGTKGVGRNTMNSYTAPYHGEVGLSVVGAGVGAATFGMLGTMGETNPLQSMGIGAAAGALAPSAIGAVGALGVGAFKHSDKIFKGMGVVGSGAAVVGRGIGRAATGITKSAFRENLKSVTIPDKIAGIKVPQKIAGKYPIGGPINRYGNMAARAMGGLLKYTPEKTYFDEGKNKLVTKRGKLGLSKKGMVAGSIIGLGVMAKGALDDIYEGRSGTPTGVTRATPSYLDNAGASGDLVFAMHQNRRG